MILLEQVSIEPLKRYASYGYFLDARIIKNEQEEIQTKIYELIEVYNITNYQELNDLIKSGNSEFDIPFFKRHMAYIDKALNRLNSAQKGPEIYHCSDYFNSSYDRKTLKLTDDVTRADSLLFVNPLFDGSLRRRLNNYSISEVKRLLNQVVILYTYGRYKENGQNAFLHCALGLGKYHTQRILSVIDFYEEQVLRQGEESEIVDADLFGLNKNIKMEIIESYINEIIEYLLDDDYEFIWGTMSETSKKALYNALKGSLEVKAVEAKYGLIDVISNYTTLKEVEEGIVRKRTIDRFIVK